MKHAISTRWVANPNRGCSHSPQKIIQSSYEYFIHDQNWRILCSLNGHIGPRIMFLIIEPGMVIMIIIERGVGFEPSNPISCKHESFWYPFLKPHLITTYHSNIGVQSKKSNRIRYILPHAA